MTTTIKELRDKREAESFTSRKDLLAEFIGLLYDGVPATSILYIHGIGGIGKTFLLQEYLEQCKRLRVPASLIGLGEKRSIVEVVTSIRNQLEPDYFNEFDIAIARYQRTQEALRQTLGSVADGILSAVREGVPFGLGALAVDTIGQERAKEWLFRQLPSSDVQLYIHADEILTEKLVVGLNVLGENGKVVLLFDEFDRAAEELDLWFRQTLLKDLGSNCILVLVGRAVDLPEGWHEWDPVLRRLELTRFSHEECLQFLARHGISQNAATQAIIDFTGRLPWALALTVNMIRDGKLDPIQLPHTSQQHLISQQVIGRFLSNVPGPELLSIIEFCSLAGAFDADLVEHCLELPQEGQSRLAELSRFSFVGRREDGRFIIHDIVRKFVQEAVRRESPRKWREWHNKAAEYYGSLVSYQGLDDPEAQYALVAHLYHVLQVDKDRGLQLLSRISEFAGRVYQLSLYERLVGELEHYGKEGKAELLHSLHSARLALKRGNQTRAQRIYETLIDNPMIWPALKAEAASDLGMIYYFQGRTDAALTMCRTGLEARKHAGDRFGEAYTLLNLGEIHSIRCEWDESLDCLRQSKSILEAQEGQSSIGLVALEMAQTYRLKGDLKQAEACCQEAMEIFDRGNDAYQLALARFRLAAIFKLSGKWRQAIHLLQASMAVLQASGDLSRVAGIHYYLGDLLRLTGRFSEAEGHLLKGLELLDRLGSSLFVGVPMELLGELHIDRGEFDGAEHWLAQSMKALEAVADEHGRGWTLLGLARLYMERAQWEEARSAALQSGEIMRRINNSYKLAEALLMLCRIDLLSGHSALQEEIVNEVQEISARHGYTDTLARLELTLGEALWRRVSSGELLLDGFYHALEPALERFKKAMESALEFNIYVLDEIVTTICSRLTDLKQQGYEQLTNQLRNELIKHWDTGRTSSQQRFMEVELKERALVNQPGYTKSVGDRLRSLL